VLPGDAPSTVSLIAGAARPFLARAVRRLLNREGERL